MSNFPLSNDYFTGGQRLTPAQSSEGGAPLSQLLNSGAATYETAVATAINIDLSTASADIVKGASRGVTTNSGAPRTFTLPDYASAPDGWTHTMVDIDSNIANTFIVIHAGTDTINGVAGDVTLNAQGEWVTVTKVTGASGWVAIGGAGVVPA
jgi:5,10-methylene-tetrahydrofolate dehydrogenase/methenyl tetrahydrofolate cyclohydrolase